MSLLDGIEFVAFIVPRLLQVGLDGFVQVGALPVHAAFGLYQAIAYVAGAALLFAASRAARPAFHQGALYLSHATAPFVGAALVLVLLGASSLLAPSSGLSLRYCNVVAAGFASTGGASLFQSP